MVSMVTALVLTSKGLLLHAHARDISDECLGRRTVLLLGGGLLRSGPITKFSSGADG